VENDQLRYCFDDHLGSSAFEVDAQAKPISQEVYYPFGGTAWLAGRHAVETSYKTIRYSGKERDATGLYYYGARYYAPWLQRWLSPDPAGEVDGLNRYLMVGNNPVVNIDLDGLGLTSVVESSTSPNKGVPSEQTNISYFDSGLQARFDSSSEESKERFDIVKNRMQHQFIKKYEIRSKYRWDDYDNVFRQHIWKFKSNYRKDNQARLLRQ